MGGGHGKEDHEEDRIDIPEAGKVKAPELV